MADDFLNNAAGDFAFAHDDGVGAETLQMLDLGIGMGARDDVDAGARDLSTTCPASKKGGMPKNERRAQQNLRAPET